MCRTTEGTRVWALLTHDKIAVYAFGFGTYVGDRLMPGWDHPDMIARCEAAIHRHDECAPLIDPHVHYGRQVEAGTMTREQADVEIARVLAAEATFRSRPVAERARELAEQMGYNPLIELERGGTVWGAQCFWTEADDGTPARFARGRLIYLLPAPDRRATRVKVEGGRYGSRLPDGAIYAGRQAPYRKRSPWANPFVVGKPVPATVRLDGQVLEVPSVFVGETVVDAEYAVRLYRYVIAHARLEDRIREEFAGRQVGCWCTPPAPCHADAIVEIANRAVRA